MCRLVRSRNKVFELQRACTDDKRTAASRAAIDAYLAKLAKHEPKSTCSFAWRNYTRFCDAQQVPIFPVSSAMMALWLYDKYSTSHEWSRTYQNYLERCARVVNLPWAGESSFQAVNRLDPTGRAIQQAVDLVIFIVNGCASKTLRWQLRDERKIAAQQSESESDEEDEAEVVIPKKKWLRRGGRPLSCRSDEGSSSAGPAHKEAKRVRLRLSASAVDADRAPTILSRRRIIISPSESSESEAGDDERALRARSPAPSPSTAPTFLDPSKRSTSPELQRPSISVRAPSSVKLLVVEPLKQPKLEDGEEGDRARPESVAGRSAPHTSSAWTSTAERRSMLSTTMPIELPDLPFSHPPLLPPTFETGIRATSSDVRLGGPLKLEASSPAPARTGRSASAPSPPIPPAVLDVEAFLVGLHPSLAPLAQLLDRAGFDSVAALSSLVFLEPAILELSLGLHRDKAGRRTKLQCRSGEPFADASVIHLTLLARRLREEGEGLRA
ncbi:hypothetical protein JCM9279_007487 [Rhodotorula babjevae]